MSKLTNCLRKINRIELIKDAKRLFVTWKAENVIIDFQDCGKTLKIFFNEKEE